jgi:hypothetical protein
MAGIWDGMDAAAMCGCMASQCHTVQCDAAHAAQYYGSQYLMPPMECHWRGYGAALHLLAASGIARHGIYAVHLNIDLIRYNEALDKNQTGQNERQESSLLERFPPVDMYVNKPSVFIDAGGRVLMWYLPGAISSLVGVSPSLQLLLSSSHDYRMRCMPPQSAWVTSCGRV